jgi:hypothetical protein
MSASRLTAQRRVLTQGSADKVQNSNTILTTQTPYRGVAGCGPRNFTQRTYFKPRCDIPCVNPNPPIPPPPGPVLDITFSVSGSVWTGTQTVSYTSIHMYIDGMGDTILDYYSGTTLVFSTTV